MPYTAMGLKACWLPLLTAKCTGNVLYFSFACAGDLQAPVGNYQLRGAIWLVVRCPFSSVEIGFKSGLATGLG